MADYPDWQKAFNLVGSTITVNVNIEASDVTLPISIDAATVTLDVNIAAQVGNITFEFADQSVAVFDAAKWFAHQGQQWGVTSTATKGDGEILNIYRPVPVGRTAYVLGVTLGYGAEAAGLNIQWWAQIPGAVFGSGSFCCGGSVIFDVPHPAEEEVSIQFSIQNRSGAEKVVTGAIWGYDEIEE